MAETRRTAKSPLDQRRSGVQVISRAATILHLLAGEPAGLALTDVVIRSGLAKSTAYRILVALESEQIIESFNGRFRIGSILRGTSMSDSDEVRRRARPFMERLASQCQETVDLGVLVGDQVMIVEQMRWVSELTAGSLIGALMPATETASGRALLASVPHRPVTALPAEGSEDADDYARTETLQADLRRIRRSKIAVLFDGYHPGISGAATFALDAHGGAFALGIPVPSVRFPGKLPELRAALLAARPEFERIVRGG